MKPFLLQLIISIIDSRKNVSTSDLQVSPITYIAKRRYSFVNMLFMYTGIISIVLQFVLEKNRNEYNLEMLTSLSMTSYTYIYSQMREMD